MSEIAAAHDINPNQLARWRQEFLERAPTVFEDPRVVKARLRAEAESVAEKDRLLKAIGQLTMERDFLQAIQAKREENRRLL